MRETVIVEAVRTPVKTFYKCVIDRPEFGGAHNLLPHPFPHLNNELLFGHSHKKAQKAQITQKIFPNLFCAFLCLFVAYFSIFLIKRRAWLRAMSGMCSSVLSS